MTSDSGIRPGDVYTYNCDNDQGYGIMVPVKTSSGWDLIDTYHLDFPTRTHGETDSAASVRRIAELGNGEHDGYVREKACNFYHRNARYGAREVPSELQLLLNLGDYDVATRRKCRDYDDDDVVIDVPLYREQHFDWDSGVTRGLCFVRKGAARSLAKEFNSMCVDAWQQLTMPSVGMAAQFVEKAHAKLREIEAAGIDAGNGKTRLLEIVMCINAIRECRDEIDSAHECYLLQTKEEDDER